MSEPTIKVRFVNATPREGSIYAQELEECLQSKAPNLKLRRASDQPQAQGVGEVLLAMLPYVPDALHLSATLSLALIEAIHVWLSLKDHHNHEVALELPNGQSVQVDRKTAEVFLALKALDQIGDHRAGPG